MENSRRPTKPSRASSSFSPLDTSQARCTSEYTSRSHRPGFEQAYCKDAPCAQHRASSQPSSEPSRHLSHSQTCTSGGTVTRPRTKRAQDGTDLSFRCSALGQPPPSAVSHAPQRHKPSTELHRAFGRRSVFQPSLNLLQMDLTFPSIQHSI